GRAGGVVGQGGELKEAAGGDGGGGGFVGAVRGRLVPVVGGGALGRGTRDVGVGGAVGGGGGAVGGAEAVGRAEAVEGPGLAAGPGGVAAPTLVGRLAKEFAGPEVEDALVGGAAVAADEIAAGGQAVVGGASEQIGVAGFVGSVEDDTDVHHDVDEAAF